MCLLFLRIFSNLPLIGILVFQAEPKAGGSITDIALSDEDDDDDMEEIFPAVGPYQVSHPNSFNNNYGQIGLAVFLHGEMETMHVCSVFSILST